jgi:mannose-6-phosphate isomerase-like protein (cupin superfamily)
MAWSRREVCTALPCLLSLPAVAEQGTSLPSKVYQFETLKVHPGKNMVIRDILDSHLRQGLAFSLHESDLGPFGVPHPPHRHVHEEMILVTEGTLDFIINGNVTRAGAGSVFFAGSGDEHGICNPVEARAKYFVLSLGSDT